MANVVYKRGQLANLNENTVPVNDGQIIIGYDLTENYGEMYVDVGENRCVVSSKVDQTYDPESANAQSGKAISEAISQIELPEIDTNNLVGQKTAENGEIFNDYENNIAGTRAYQIESSDADAMTYTLASSEGLDSITLGAEGDRISIKWGSTYINAGYITAINENVITVVIDYIDADKGTPVTNLISSTGEGVLFFVTHPELGNVVFDSAQHAEGEGTQAVLEGAHAEGRGTKAIGRGGHSEGKNTIAVDAAHAEGNGTQALGWHSHTEGEGTIATAKNAHTEGTRTKATGVGAHAEGNQTQALMAYAHTEGTLTEASGESAHAEGRGLNKDENDGVKDYTQASGLGSHAEGQATKAVGNFSHSEGRKSQAIGYASHSEGQESKASGLGAHAEGYKTNANGDNSHSEGQGTTASGAAAHTEGNSTVAQGTASHSEGINTIASGDASHAEGRGLYANENDGVIQYNEASGYASHVEGMGSQAKGNISHAEGRETQATNYASHAEGYLSIASGNTSHAEGYNCQAKGQNSHAEGQGAIASGVASHAENYYTTAKGSYSHASGNQTRANYSSQTVVGKFNKNRSDTLFEVGNGTGNSDSERSNAFQVYALGHGEIQKVGTTDESIINKKYLETTISNLIQWGSSLPTVVDENSPKIYIVYDITE